MGAEAQQALSRRRPPSRSGGTHARNVAGTGQAQGKALRDSIPSGTALSRKGGTRAKRQALPRKHGDIKGQAQYGGMGYGPMEVEPGHTRPLSFSQDSDVMKRARTKADPSQLVRDAVDALSTPRATPSGASIWDDERYRGLAERYGADFALKARNLDEEINQANRMQKIRQNTLSHANEMERMKLEGRQLEAANRMYLPESKEGPYDPGQAPTGVDPHTGLPWDGSHVEGGTGQPSRRGNLATDASGAYTGENKQASMVGEGPASERQHETQQNQAQRQHEIRTEAIKSVTQALQSAIENRDDKMVVELSRTLNRLTSAGSEKPVTGEPKSAKDVLEMFKQSNPGIDEEVIRNSPKYKNALEKFGLSE